LRVVDDQIGCPTWSSDIAQVIGKIITKKEHISTGIYHFTGSGETSWYGFALYIFQEAKKLGFPLTVHDVIPISTQQYPTLAIRPAYSVLSNDSLSECLGISASHWQDSLPKMLEELRSII
jgi:dTDP-4-dehydrorhamnose reductase